MPAWAYAVARCNPMTWFIEAARMVILKGSRFADLRVHFAVMSGFAVLFNLWAVINYRKTT
jgi:ABC-2 type transport system permease protein